MKNSRLASFIILAVMGVVVLSIAWVWIGPIYSQLVNAVSSPFLPDGTTLERVGNDIKVHSTGHLDGVGGASWVMHSMAMSYGLIVGVVVLAVMPGLGSSSRAVYLVGILLVTMATHVAGLLTLVGKVNDIAQGTSPADAIAPLGRTLTYAWLFIPSVIWLPVLLTHWPRSAKRDWQGSRSRALHKTREV